MLGTDEAVLVAGFAAGDEHAVRAVYARYGGPILTVAMATLGKRELADEAVQATMLKAWRAAASFDPMRPLSPWLYAIARRVAVDIHRRERRAAAPVEAEEDDDLATIPLSFERTWEAWEVRQAIATLPLEEREVVRLAHLGGMSHREVAEHLDVPPATVEARSARGHRRLAALLGHVVRVTE